MPPPEAALVGGVAPPADPAARLASAEQREDDAIVAAHAADAEADAARRIREVDQVRMAAEGSAADAQFASDDAARRAAAEQPGGPSPFAGELRLTDEQIERRRRRDEELQSELERTESTIAANKNVTEQALQDAQRRLDEIEAQASEAEKRAERAEKLAELRREEADRERHLHAMLERINEAEGRAREAEARARQAVAGVTKPIDPGTAPPAPLPPQPDPEPLASLAEQPPPAAAGVAAAGMAAAVTSSGPADEPEPPVDEPEPPADEPAVDLPSPPAPDDPAPEAPAATEEPPADGPAEPEEVVIKTADLPSVGALTGSAADRGDESPVAPDFENEGASESIGSPGDLPAPSAPADAISLNSATFEELRGAGLSVTQTGRVLAHRERGGGFSSVDELDEIPGFPRDFLEQVKPKLTT